MQNMLTNKLKKQVTGFKHHFLQKQVFSREDIISYMQLMESHLLKQFRDVSNETNKMISETKNELKKKNKYLNELKVNFEKKQFEWTKQREQFKRENQKNKKKIQDLIKLTEQNYTKVNSTKKIQLQTQCDLESQHWNHIVQNLKKQNILMSQKIQELQQIIREKNQDYEDANVLIRQLILQLETNLNDRQTGNGSQSRNSSDLDSQSQISQISLSFQVNQINYLAEEDSVQCGGPSTAQDCSTIDGSNATNKDFALPEWLQFDQQEEVAFEFYQSQDDSQKSLKMWPQLLWNRFRQLIGFTYQL